MNVEAELPPLQLSSLQLLVALTKPFDLESMANTGTPAIWRVAVSILSVTSLDVVVVLERYSGDPTPTK